MDIIEDDLIIQFLLKINILIYIYRYREKKVYACSSRILIILAPLAIKFMSANTPSGQERRCRLDGYEI